MKRIHTLAELVHEIDGDNFDAAPAHFPLCSSAANANSLL
jgi:hypothetical protein